VEIFFFEIFINFTIFPEKKIENFFHLLQGLYTIPKMRTDKEREKMFEENEDLEKHVALSERRRFFEGTKLLYKI